MVSPEEYHVLVGGRIRRDRRKKYENTEPPKAGDIREQIVNLRERSGMTNKQIALHIGCSPSRLTMLSQRRAGDKIREEGFSTTQILSSRIKGLLNNLDIVHRIFYPNIGIQNKRKQK